VVWLPEAEVLRGDLSSLQKDTSVDGSNLIKRLQKDEFTLSNFKQK